MGALPMNAAMPMSERSGRPDPEDGPQVLRVVADALFDAERHLGALEDEPALVADALEGRADGREVDRALAVEVLVVLGVELQIRAPRSRISASM